MNHPYRVRKHAAKVLLALVPLLFAAAAARGQDHAAGAQFGAGIWTLLRLDDVSVTVDDRSLEARLRGSPATSLTYDYRLDPRWSVGAIASHQALRLRDIRAVDGGADVSGTLRLTRVLLGVRGLVHYGPRDRRAVDLYSGLRAGLTVWSLGGSADLGTRDVDLDLFGLGVGGVTPQLTVIALGYRHTVAEVVYLGAELAVGSPHFIAAQAGVRF